MIMQSAASHYILMLSSDVIEFIYVDSYSVQPFYFGPKALEVYLKFYSQPSNLLGEEIGSLHSNNMCVCPCRNSPWVLTVCRLVYHDDDAIQFILLALTLLLTYRYFVLPLMCIWNIKLGPSTSSVSGTIFL